MLSIPPFFLLLLLLLLQAVFPLESATENLRVRHLDIFPPSLTVYCIFLSTSCCPSAFILLFSSLLQLLFFLPLVFPDVRNHHLVLFYCWFSRYYFTILYVFGIFPSSQDVVNLAFICLECVLISFKVGVRAAEVQTLCKM